MNKIGLMTDSSSLMTAKEAKFYGVYLLPLRIVFSNNTTIADIASNYDKYDIWNGIENSSVIGTSQNNPEEIKAVFDQALLENEHLIYLPIAANLSSQCASAQSIANNPPYKGRITVLKQYSTAFLLKFIVIKAVQKAQSGDDLTSILDFVIASEKKAYTGMMPGNLETISRSGRVNKIILKVLNFSRAKLLIRWGEKGKLANFSLTVRNMVKSFARQYFMFVKGKPEEYLLLLCGNKKHYPLNSVKAMQTLSQLKIKYKFFDNCGVYSIHAGVGILAFFIIPLSLVPNNLMNAGNNN